MSVTSTPVTHANGSANKSRTASPNTPTVKRKLLTQHHTYTQAEQQALPEPISYPIFCVHWHEGSTLYVGGGGGRAGTGINSGVTMCNVIVGTSITSPTYTDYIAKHKSGTAIDAINVNEMGVLPVAFVDTGAENLVFDAKVYPNNSNELVLACSNTMCILDRQFKYLVKNAVQTDYNTDEDGEVNCNMINVFSADGRYVATGGEDRMVQIYNYTTLKHISHTHSSVHTNTVSSLCFDRTSTLLCTTGADANLHVFRVPTTNTELKPLYTLQHTVNKKPCIYRSAVFVNNTTSSSSDILCVVNGSVRGPSHLLKYRPCNTGEFILVKQTLVSKSAAMQLCVDRSTKQAAVATADGSLYIYNVETMKRVTQRLNIHELPITGLTFSPDGKLLLSAAADKTLNFTKTQPVTTMYKLVYSVIPTVLIACMIAALLALLLEFQPYVLRHNSITQYSKQHRPMQTWFATANDQLHHLGHQLPHIKANMIYYFDLLAYYTHHALTALITQLDSMQRYTAPYIDDIRHHVKHHFHQFVTNEHKVLRTIDQYLHAFYRKVIDSEAYKLVQIQIQHLLHNKVV